MRNFRKTRKRGGAGVVFHCLPRRTANKTCINDFAVSNGFKFTDVPPDGNCFFHTLHLYFKKRQDPVALADKNYFKELRRVVVDYLAVHVGNYPGLTAADVQLLRGDHAWDEVAGDYVVPGAAAALGLTIHLYDLQDPIPARAERPASGVGRNAVSYMPAVPAVPKHIVFHTYPEVPPAGWVQNGVVHIMRMADSHFGLLEPVAPVAAPPVAAAAPPAPAPKKASRKPKVAPAPPPRAPSPPPRAPSPPPRAPSPPKVNRRTARQKAANAAKAAKAPTPPPAAPTRRRKPRVAPAPKPANNNSEFNNEMQAALLASAKNATKNQQRANNEALAIAMQQAFKNENAAAAAARKKQEENNANLARAIALSLGK
jgi:hypothetical protein